MLDDPGGSRGQDVHEFPSSQFESVLELVDIVAVLLVDSADHGVEVVSKWGKKYLRDSKQREFLN